MTFVFLVQELLFIIELHRTNSGAEKILEQSKKSKMDTAVLERRIGVFTFTERLRIVKSALGDNAGVIGMATLARRK